MKEDDPFLPGKAERLLQLIDVLHDAKAAQGIGMLERIDSHDLGGHLQDAGRDKFEQRLASLCRQVCRNVQELVLGRRQHVIDPVYRYADDINLSASSLRNGRVVLALGCRLEREDIDTIAEIELLLNRPRARHLFDPLANLDNLDRAGLRVRLDAPPLGPFVGAIVMVNVGQEKLCAVLWTMIRMSRLTRHDQKFGSFEASMR